MLSTKNSRIISSILIGIVFFLNIQAGIDFFLFPEKFLPAYELAGVPGEISVAGVGILFLMWNVPYAFALWNPLKNKISLYQATIMQMIGVVGETALFFRFSHLEHPFLAASIKRFIYFDSAGLVFLFIASLVITRTLKKQRGNESHAVRS